MGVCYFFYKRSGLNFINNKFFFFWFFDTGFFSGGNFVSLKKDFFLKKKKNRKWINFFFKMERILRCVWIVEVLFFGG